MVANHGSLEGQHGVENGYNTCEVLKCRTIVRSECRIPTVDKPAGDSTLMLRGLRKKIIDPLDQLARIIGVRFS